MRKTTLLVCGFALLLLALPTKSLADACPGVGYASGCNLTITFGTGGTVSTTIGVATPYDGFEDQLVGIVNNSGSTLNGITLSGSKIFGFDGDGASAGGTGCTLDQTGGTFGCPVAMGPTGYEGPNTGFTIVDNNNGTVTFTGGLASGKTAWFSLEETASLQGFTVTGTTGVPEPSSLLLLGVGLASLAGLALRRSVA